MVRSANTTVLGLALVTLGCVDTTGTMDAGETGGADDPTGDGDGDGDADAFELVSAELDAAGQTVTLHFSKPVAPVDAVEPDDFRISHAAPTEVCGDGGCEPETTYWDANFYVEYYLSYEQPAMTRFEVTSISLGEDTHDVRLQFGTPLDPAFCEYLTTYAAEYYPDYIALLVHHAPGDIPLTSADGEPLGAIGPEWVEQEFPVMTAPGEFLEHLDPRIEIPCP